MPIGDTRIEDHLKRVRLLSELDAWFKFFDGATKKQIIRTVQERLRTKGTNSDNEVIGLYSLATEFISKGKKEHGTHFTFFDTGDFYASMFVVVFVDAFIVEADAKKDDDNLFEKYGENIISLTDEELEIVKRNLKNHYITYARRVLQID